MYITMYSGNLPNSGYRNNLSQFLHQAFSHKYSLNFNISSALKYSITEEDMKIRFSEISKVNVFQDPYVNEITCADPFR